VLWVVGRRMDVDEHQEATSPLDTHSQWHARSQMDEVLVC
jgi:hypothetical protein